MPQLDLVILPHEYYLLVLFLILIHININLFFFPILNIFFITSTFLDVLTKKYNYFFELNVIQYSFLHNILFSINQDLYFKKPSIDLFFAISISSLTLYNIISGTKNLHYSKSNINFFGDNLVLPLNRFFLSIQSYNLNNI